MGNVATKYPIQPGATGRLVMVDENTSIGQSIRNILRTPIARDRFFNEGYGSYCSKLTFEPNDAILRGMLNYFAADALYKWEKRIRVVDIMFETMNENQTNMIILYVRVKNNVFETFTYPFYREIVY